MTDSNTELHLLLGRVEGKVDLILLAQKTDRDRIDTLEEQQRKTAQKVTSLEAKATSAKTWVSSVISALALLFSGLTYFKEHIH